jgi:hypothetical protein
MSPVSLPGPALRRRFSRQAVVIAQKSGLLHHLQRPDENQ